LALIFAIPGVYLEWPSDPWEHFRRITEWSIHPVVGAHSAGYKSFYFFAYSLYELAPNLDHFTRLSSYSTGISLLLAWQYYRLASAVGLDQRWAFLFVLGNTLTFGNVCFSFYKYYGLSSTMYAQLGAVALTRIALETAKDSQFSLPDFFRRSQLSTLSSQLVSATCLLALIAFNHVQGLGIAGLSAGSIIIWRLLKWKRSTGWWLLGGAIILSAATVLWWPRHPTIDAVYRPGGWLNAWYGFNFFTWPSPAADRAMQILGLLGLINLGAGVFLLRRNHVVAWLTALPILALALPVVALPFANKLAASSTVEIITFHRLLFAIPSGLALAVYAKLQIEREISSQLGKLKRLGASMLIIVLAGGLFTISPDRFSNNRLWNLLATIPQDLSLRPLLSISNSTAVALRNITDRHLITAIAIANILNTNAPTEFPRFVRSINRPVANILEDGETFILSNKPSTDRDHTALNRDPLMKDQNAWASYSPAQPEFINTITDFEPSSTALRNPAGRTMHLFSADSIPIDPTKSYRLEMSLRQYSGTQSIAYLAVFWYNSAGVPLPSNKPIPSGAGFPAGWTNEGFSYFGPAGEAPRAWTTYRITFGPNEQKIIPSNARSVKVGAVLNVNVAPAAIIQLSNVRLWEKSPAELSRDGAFRQFKDCFVLMPSRELFFTPVSQAGQLSYHWPAQQLAVDLAGEAEWTKATLAAGGIPVENNDYLFELRVSPRSVTH